MLESALAKDRHFESCDRLDPPSDHVAFELVKFGFVIIGQGNERNSLGLLDHRWTSKWTEALKTEMAGGRIGASVGTAQATRIGEGVLHLSHPPAFLVEEPIIDDAADCELRVLLDWVILQILIATIAIHQESPLRVPLSDPSAEGQRHRRRLKIECFVILDDANSLERIQTGGFNLNWLQKKLQAQ